MCGEEKQATIKLNILLLKLSPSIFIYIQACKETNDPSATEKKRKKEKKSIIFSILEEHWRNK